MDKGQMIRISQKCLRSGDTQKFRQHLLKPTVYLSLTWHTQRATYICLSYRCVLPCLALKSLMVIKFTKSATSVWSFWVYSPHCATVITVNLRIFFFLHEKFILLGLCNYKMSHKCKVAQVNE